MASANSTTVSIDRDVAKALKVYAAEEGLTMKSVIERALLEAVSRHPAARKARRNG
jgi:hypothetical protein